jgi:Xaa-Pro aminopeptidase
MYGETMGAAAERILTPISDQELERRWTAIRREMRDRSIDALIMQATNDWLGGYVKWFTDLPATNGYPRTVLIYVDEPMTVVEMGPFGTQHTLDGNDPIHRGVGERLLTPSFHSIAYTNDYDAQLAVAALRRHPHRTVGLIGAGAMPHAFVAGIKTSLTSTAFVDATEFIDRIKAIKSPEEIALIRRTAEVQDAVFAKVLEYIRPGRRDVDITALAQYEGQLLGSEQGIFLGGSSPTGQRSPFVPRFMQGRTLKEGDQLSLLIENNGPGGFYAELARTIALGRASNELTDAFEAVKQAQAHTLSAMRPGTPCRDVAAAHDAFMEQRGLPPELRLYAHGQGYDMVERPLIRRDETMALEVGMCLAVHPGYETPSLFAVICDNYIMEAGGPSACLHRTPKKVFEL